MKTKRKKEHIKENLELSKIAEHFGFWFLDWIDAQSPDIQRSLILAYEAKGHGGIDFVIDVLEQSEHDLAELSKAIKEGLHDMDEIKARLAKIRDIDYEELK